jgi:type IV pilus assembly protein PilY1
MKRKSLKKTLLLLSLIGLISAAPMSVAIGAEMNTYTSYPLFLSSTVKPNVMIILDTSTSMLEFAYNQTSGMWSTNTSDPIGTYDGYFDTSKNYSYDATNDYFYVDASGIWSGNLLNFICMRRMDIAKKVLTGGRTTTAADGSTVLQCQPFPNNCGWSGGYDQYKKFKLSGSTTYARHYRVVDAKGGYFYLCNSIGSPYGTQYYTRVKVTSTPQGIVQQNAPFVNLGLAIYGTDITGGDTNQADQGGKVLNPVGDSSASIVTNINAQDMLADPAASSHDTWTQMAETLYTVVGYFAQEASISLSYGPRYHAADYTVSNAWDPYYSTTGDVACVKSFVILISDGEANHDAGLPASLKTTHGVTSGDPYLDDVAYWAHTTDIRSSSFGIDTAGTQTITTYTVSTFGGGTTLLKSTAKYGGFIDSNGNNLPDLTSEYDADNDGDPDNYFAANNAAELTNALTQALVDIQEKAATSTAISVLATSGEGEGNMVQAYFKPKALAGASEIRWAGYLHSLWVDTHGNLREDTDNKSCL